MRGASQPPFSDHSMVSMWSENCLPNTREAGSGLGLHAALRSTVRSAAWGRDGRAGDRETSGRGREQSGGQYK